MSSDSDIIAAIITPPGEGGVGAIRVAGPGSRELCAQFLGWSADVRSFYFSYTRFSAGETALDEVMAVWMPSGKSYTGDEQVEIFSHGGRIVLQKILRVILDAGARAAEPGEFTKRAFLAGRIDLTRAEAVAELISAKSEFAYHSARDKLFGAASGVVTDIRNRLVGLSAQLAANVDFPEEEIDPAQCDRLLLECRQLDTEILRLVDSYKKGVIIRDGYRVALAGRPNAGKSSLFNSLLGKHRALVSETPGTTRDYLSEWITLGGYAIELIDTAGLRDTNERIESAGQELTRELIESAHLTLWIVDSAEPLWPAECKDDLADYPKSNMLIALNKVDLHATPLQPGNEREVCVSCKTGEGFAELEGRIIQAVERSLPDQTDGYLVTSERHQQKLFEAHKALEEVRAGLESARSPELVAFDVRQAVNLLDEITGKIYTDDILERIFSQFCVGK